MADKDGTRVHKDGKFEQQSSRDSRKVANRSFNAYRCVIEREQSATHIHAAISTLLRSFATNSIEMNSAETNSAEMMDMIFASL